MRNTGERERRGGFRDKKSGFEASFDLSPFENLEIEFAVNNESVITVQTKFIQTV